MMNLISPRVLRFAARSVSIGAVLASLLLSATASADTYEDTIDAFRSARDTAPFFDNAYGYAVFPTIGKGGLGIGGAHGAGRVYAQGRHVGDTEVTQLTLGLQMGIQAFSQIIFLQDRRASPSASAPAARPRPAPAL